MFAAEVTTVAEEALGAASAIVAIRIAAPRRRNFEEGECRVTLSPNSTRPQELRNVLLYSCVQRRSIRDRRSYRPLQYPGFSHPHQCNYNGDSAKLDDLPAAGPLLPLARELRRLSLDGSANVLWRTALPTTTEGTSAAPRDPSWTDSRTGRATPRPLLRGAGSLPRSISPGRRGGIPARLPQSPRSDEAP